MTKLLVSDYDQTLNIKGVSKSDIRKIERFVNAGNIFVVASSRHYQSLGAQMEEYNIPFSYLSCNNANAIFDRNRKLISVTYLSEEEKKLINSLKINAGIIEAKDAYGIANLRNILYYLITLKEGKEFSKEVLPLIEDQTLESDYYLNMGYLFSSQRQKDFACEVVGQTHDIAPEDIYTIGDGANDVAMLSSFNGYTFPWGVDAAKQSALGEVESVGQFIDMIEEEKALTRKRVL